MKTAIVSVVAIMLLLLSIACQGTDEDIGRLVDERVIAALAVDPTVTPQPTATPQDVSQTISRLISIDQLEATLESLAGRLALAESKLLAQDGELHDLIKIVNDPDNPNYPNANSPDNRIGAIVTAAVESTSGGVCWLYRAENGGKGNTFLVEWNLQGESGGLCYNPSSTCVQEVEIGGVLPDSCLG